MAMALMMMIDDDGGGGGGGGGTQDYRNQHAPRFEEGKTGMERKFISINHLMMMMMFQ
jgi:hypothetical protein